MKFVNCSLLFAIVAVCSAALDQCAYAESSSGLSVTFTEESTEVEGTVDTPDPTPTPTPSPTPTLNRTPTPTPTPTVTPTSQCLAANAPSGGRFGAEAGQKAYGGGTAELQACVQRIYESFGASGRAYQAGDIKNMSFRCGADEVKLTCWSGQHIDCEQTLNGVNLEEQMQGLGYSGTPTAEQWAAIDAHNRARAKSDDIIDGRCPTAGDQLVVTNERGQVLDHNPWVDTGMDDYVYNNISQLIDSRCQLSTPKDEAMCGFWIAYRPTPLSLVWNSSSDSESTLTSFPVDPNGKGKLFSWRGSASFPLVVFDPQHTGKISDASQLFGNFSFGKSFKNGFEALAALDANHSGSVEDNELAAVALWFDRNRDGVSDPGEVVPAPLQGVVSLSTSYDEQDENSGDLISHDGFVYESNGERGSGQSVDWLSSPFDSVSQAIHQSKDSMAFTPDQFAKVLTRDVKAIEGLWKWHQNIPGNENGLDGALLIRVRGNKIIGYSFTHTALAPNPQNYIAHLSIQKLTGSFQSDESGDISLNFTTSSPQAATNNRAVISSDGKLSGETLLTLTEQKAPIRFHWSAKK